MVPTSARVLFFIIYTCKFRHKHVSFIVRCLVFFSIRSTLFIFRQSPPALCKHIYADNNNWPLSKCDTFIGSHQTKIIRTAHTKLYYKKENWNVFACHCLSFLTLDSIFIKKNKQHNNAHYFTICWFPFSLYACARRCECLSGCQHTRYAICCDATLLFRPECFRKSTMEC